MVSGSACDIVCSRHFAILPHTTTPPSILRLYSRLAFDEWLDLFPPSSLTSVRLRERRIRARTARSTRAGACIAVQSPIAHTPNRQRRVVYGAMVATAVSFGPSLTCKALGTNNHDPELTRCRLRRPRRRIPTLNFRHKTFTMTHAQAVGLVGT